MVMTNIKGHHKKLQSKNCHYIEKYYFNMPLNALQHMFYDNPQQTEYMFGLVFLLDQKTLVIISENSQKSTDRFCEQNIYFPTCQSFCASLGCLHLVHFLLLKKKKFGESCQSKIIMLLVDLARDTSFILMLRIFLKCLQYIFFAVQMSYNNIDQFT